MFEGKRDDVGLRECGGSMSYKEDVTDGRKGELEFSLDEIII